MSDDTTAAPVENQEPAVTETAPEESVTLKVPTTDPEGVDSPVEVAEEGSGTEGTGEGPEEPTEPAEGQEEGTGEVEEDTVTGPVVSNNPDGQTVTFEDGTVVHTRAHGYPMTNREQEQYELTHQGDQLRYPYVPGDKEYTPYSDPSVPNSHIAQMIERDIASYAERVLTDPKARVSPQWDAFHGIYEGQLEQAIASGGGSGKVQA